MSLYPLGISRRCDVPNAPKQSSSSLGVRWTVSGDLACAYIDAPHQAVPPLLHAATLDAIHRRICVLPIRFGVALNEEGEICSLLHHHKEELLRRLNKIDRMCEMGLRISSPPDGVSQESAEPDNSQQGNVVRQYVECLRGYFEQWRKLENAPSRSIRLAFLVKRDNAGPFRLQLEKACNAEQRKLCAILGPWPPYSFV